MIVRDLSLDMWLQTRSSEYRDAAIEQHRYLCVRAAKKFVRDGIERADLEQIAAIGLIKAVDRFDDAEGTPFEGYAWVLILGELMHYVRDCERMLRAPRRVRELERKYVCAERELLVLLGREPSETEVADYVGCSSEERREVQRYRLSSAPLSVDALPPYDHRHLAYTIEGHVDAMVIRAGIEALAPLEREILTEIYERGTPLVALAERLGYSRRHVTRLHRAALDKLTPYARLV